MPPSSEEAPTSSTPMVWAEEEMFWSNVRNWLSLPPYRTPPVYAEGFLWRKTGLWADEVLCRAQDGTLGAWLVEEQAVEETVEETEVDETRLAIGVFAHSVAITVQDMSYGIMPPLEADGAAQHVQLALSQLVRVVMHDGMTSSTSAPRSILSETS